MRLRVITSLVMVLGLCAGQALASSVGVFFDAGATDCDGTLLPFASNNVYVVALLGGDAAVGGMTGAEFRVDGAPASTPQMIVTWAVNPAAQNTSVGNPLLGGANVAFPSCQPGPLVSLGTISIIPLSMPAPTGVLRVERHTTPSNASFQCPLLVLCDAPEFTKVCVAGGEAFYDGRSCAISVEEKSWSGVKSLFN